MGHERDQQNPSPREILLHPLRSHQPEAPKRANLGPRHRHLLKKELQQGHRLRPPNRNRTVDSPHLSNLLLHSLIAADPQVNLREELPALPLPDR